MIREELRNMKCFKLQNNVGTSWERDAYGMVVAFLISLTLERVEIPLWDVELKESIARGREGVGERESEHAPNRPNNGTSQ